MKTITTIAVVAAVHVCALAGEPAVVGQLRNDIAGKSVTLATDVAGYSCIYSSTLDFPTKRLVDTEIDSQNGTRYFLRADRFMNVTKCPDPVGRTNSMYGEYIGSRMVSRMYPSGTSAVVKAIEAKADRIEIQLQAEGNGSGDEAYAKLKLMLGKGYESLSLEKVESALALGIRMPRIESINELRAKLDDVNRSIADLERQLSTERDAAARVNVAKPLLTQYQAQAEMQDRFNAVAFERLAAAPSSSRIAELNAVIAAAERQVQEQNIQIASNRYSNAMLAVKQSCDRVGTAQVNNLADLDRLSVSIQTAQTDMAHFAEARQGMVAFGETIPSADDQFYASCKAELATAADGVVRQRPELIQMEAKAAERRRRQQVAEAIAGLRTEFARMKQERAEYDAKLMSALGQDEATVFAEYRLHLQRMIANRQQALDLGDDAARMEINSLQGDIKKLH